MSNFTIILPVYNDWRSLNVLINRIENSLKNTKNIYKILLINDCSTEKNPNILNYKKFFKEIKILNLRKNVGNQKAIATALKYINTKEKGNNGNYIIMDSDGEDDPKKIKEIIKYLRLNKKTEIITLNRTIRKESFFFSILYELHLFITFLLTFNYIRFGNFSCINKKILKKISGKNDLWMAYSATINKFFKNKHSISAPRKKRINGKSKMSYFGLIKHSISIHSVYKKNIFFSYFLYLIFLIYLSSKGIPLILIVIFVFLFFTHLFILIYLNQKKVNGISFNKCLNNIKTINKF